MKTTNETVAVAGLKPHPRNYNQHPAEQVRKLAKSLGKFGQVRSVVVWRSTILAGHGVVEAARALGWESVRADVLPDEYPEHLALGYVAADNELAKQGDPDMAQLLAILEESKAADAELLAAIGYSDKEFEALLAEVGSTDKKALSDVEPQVEDFPVSDLLSPYPYFGGKRAMAGAVWARFGQVDNYVEPFFGSGAMLLSSPYVPGIETVNDLDGFIANFWRAVQADPVAVAGYVDWPTNENDLLARHLWLVNQRSETTRRLDTDPEWYDAKIAGWWCWGACNWIGTGWCSGDGPWQVDGDQVRQLPHVGNAGRGDGQCAAWSEHLTAMMQRLSDRLRRVRVACGDWSRIVSGSVTDRHGLTAVFLDPPYGQGAMEYSAGGNNTASISDAVRTWCIANGGNPQMRIAFCGYEPLSMPGDWRALRWLAPKGYQNAENAKNRYREIIWFSPHCLAPVLVNDG